MLAIAGESFDNHMVVNHFTEGNPDMWNNDKDPKEDVKSYDDVD